jgi:hypothetical protein
VRVIPVIALGAVGVFAAVVSVGALTDADGYARWSTAMPDTGSPVTRAQCAEVTLDWDACFVLGAARRTDSEWRAEWSSRSQGALVRAGIGVLVATLCVAGSLALVIIMRRRPPPAAPSNATSPPAEPMTDWPTLPDRLASAPSVSPSDEQSRPTTPIGKGNP